jgi:uncharacterized protein involved in exopolysaccharide biosynthesis
MLPQKFESSTTIWAQPDEILNPLVSYQMAVQLASADRLETFREIVYARRTIESVLDSLSVNVDAIDGIQLDDMIERIRRNTGTARKGSDSFTISYIDTDPVRAQQMVRLLAKVFIETRIRGEAQRNDATVKFFERKLAEYQDKFETTQHEMLNLFVQRLKERPTGSGELYTKISTLDQRMNSIQARLRESQQGLARLGLFPDAFHTDQGRQAIAELRRSNLPYADELRNIMGQYDDVTARYTSMYPEVGKIENQVLEVLRKMRVAVQADIAGMTAELDELRNSKSTATNELMQYSVDERVDTDKKSDYALFQRLYEDMKTKLEQARMTRELGKNAEGSFIIIDPARVPAKPSRPNRPMIIGGGVVLGLFLGIACAMVVEMLDSRVRSPRDLQSYGIPVIALLPESGGR